ncbi:hypothetical protein RRG08_007686, partial [Elysia crispata]
TAGLKAASQLSDYLHLVGRNNILIPDNITKTLTYAVDRLIYKAATHGINIVKGIVRGDRKRHIKQNKEDCKKGIESLKKITDAMFRTMYGRHKYKIVSENLHSFVNQL